MSDNICHICKRPKDSIGSSVCSFPHPISRKQFEQAIITVRIEENEKWINYFKQVKEEYLISIFEKAITGLKKERDNG